MDLLIHQLLNDSKTAKAILHAIVWGKVLELPDAMSQRLE